MANKTTKKWAKKSSSKVTLMALSKVEEKELILDTKTFEKLESFLAKTGGQKSGLTLSDLVTHLLLKKGQNGFKFSKEINEEKPILLTLPKAAWDIAKKSEKKSGNTDLSEVIKELASEL